MCRVRWAVARHHEPPKSLDPRACESDGYPVCNECHDKLQDMQRSEAQELLSKVTVTSALDIEQTK